MSSVDAEPITRQVIQHAEAISRLRHDLDRLASEITDGYADLLGRINQLTDGAGGHVRPPDIGNAPWSWRTIGPRAREHLWAALHEWVAWIRGRYPLARKIPDCWDQHPEIVEELTALWLSWQAAYEGSETTLTAASDWHDRWLPGLLHRLEHGAFSIDCATAHRPRSQSCYATHD